MKIGICNLCLQEKELCKESHIIPRSLYRFISGPNKSLVYVGEGRASTRFNSEYDSNILCKECDALVLGKLDNYFAKYNYGELKEPVRSQLQIIDGSEHLVVESDANYDYAKYKLFLLSVLWRSSISARPFFSKVKLPKDIEEDLRVRILVGDPGAEDVYPCFIHTPPLIDVGNGQRGFVSLYMQTMSPRTVENDDWLFVEYLIQGTRYYFILKRPAHSNVRPSVSKKGLEMKIATIEEYRPVHDAVLKMVDDAKNPEIDSPDIDQK